MHHGVTADIDGSSSEEEPGQPGILASPRHHAEILAGVVIRMIGGGWIVADRAGLDPGTVVVDLPFPGEGLCLAAEGSGPADVAAATLALETVRPLVDALVEAEQREGEARALAMTDHLTGLLNRWGWEVALAAEESRCQRHGHSAVIAVVDLDDLKKVNDADGHLGGDMLLRMTADALRRGCRREDIVARIGGDEFALIAVEDRAGDQHTFAERLRATLTDAGVAASVGAAVRSQLGGLRSAFRYADGAMYADKLARKRCVR